MIKKHTFSGYHPAINFVFFVMATVCGMIFMHPAFLLCSALAAVTFTFTVRGKTAGKLLQGVILLFLMISAINPIFNPRGKIILFTYWGRPYTAEALFYGMAIGGMMVSVLFWFSSYNAIMTSDKFTYLFGGVMPSATLLLTMVLRFVPTYRRKIRQIGYARASIGKGISAGKRRALAENGLTILSALTSWALEASIITSDSMRSRGYGTGKRGRFAQYRFIGRDRMLLGGMLLLSLIIITCAAEGAATVSYTPHLQMTPLKDPRLIVGLSAYAIFLFLPTALYIREEITWHILKSRI